MNEYMMRSCQDCGLACDKGDIPFKYVELSPSSNLDVHVNNFNHVLFLISGRVEVSHIGKKRYVVDEGNMTFLFKDNVYTITSVQKSVFLLMSLSGKLNICQSASVYDLHDEVKKAKRNNDDNILPIYDSMGDFVKSVITFANDKVSCIYLHNIKRIELFLIFRHYYTIEQIVHLFYPILDGEHFFRSLVLANYKRARNIKHLAELCGYGLSNFKLLFKKYFNQPPHQWILENMAPDIRLVLMDKNVPIKAIASQFNFSDQSHFNSYCKKYLGGTPGQIREKS